MSTAYGNNMSLYVYIRISVNYCVSIYTRVCFCAYIFTPLLMRLFIFQLGQTLRSPIIRITVATIPHSPDVEMRSRDRCWLVWLLQCWLLALSSGQEPAPGGVHLEDSSFNLTDEIKGQVSRTKPCAQSRHDIVRGAMALLVKIFHLIAQGFV